MRKNNAWLIFRFILPALMLFFTAVNADAAERRTFSQAFKETTPVARPKIAKTASGETVSSTSSKAPARIDGGYYEEVNQNDNSWHLFGFSPVYGVPDRSMFPNPNGCVLTDGSPCTPINVWKPCTKRCGVKCQNPCSKKCKTCVKTACAPQTPMPVCQPIVEQQIRIIPEEPAETFQDYMTIMEDEIYKSVHHECGDFAPVDLQYVDFRLQNGRSYGQFSDRLGKYRFRIFGCRRDAKNVTLNQGRTLQKDMHFINIFNDITDGCIKTAKVPADLCLNPNQELPEYVMTAEITDFFMNVCDEYNWDEAKKENRRNGTAEIKVTWRIMDLTKTNVLWKGNTIGYADVENGEYNGELMLVERAFADAVDNLRQQPGFENQLATRVNPEELATQRQMIIDYQVENTPLACGYHPKSALFAPEEEIVKITTVTEVVEDSAPACTTVDEFGNIISTGICPIDTVDENADTLIEVKKVDEDADVADFGKLCIKDRAPYDNFNTDELNEIKSSVVSVTNANGLNGAGILLSEQYVLTSASVIIKDNNAYEVEVNGETVKASAFRINTAKEIALLQLEKEVKYTPLAYSFEVPDTGKNIISLGVSENNKGTVTGYRYSDTIGSEIVTDTLTPKAGSLIDNKGTVFGFAHKQNGGEYDIFIPVETSMQSLGLEICGREFTPKRKYTPITDALMTTTAQAPEILDKKQRK